MSYLLAQILICLLIAGLIGALVGWLLRGGCGRKLSENDEQWNLRLKALESEWESELDGISKDYDAKISSADGEIKSLKRDHESKNDEWSLKLKNQDTSWEGKIQSLVGDYDAKNSSANNELEKLKKELAFSRDEIENLNSSFEGKIKTLRGDYDNRCSKIEDLEKELEDANGSWSLKLKDSETSWESKIQSVKSDYESKSLSANSEAQTLKRELEEVKKELADANGKWSLKLKDSSLGLENKMQSLTDSYDAKISNLNNELEYLKSELISSAEDTKKAKDELEDAKSELESKNSSLNSQTQSLKAEIKALDDSWSLKLKNQDLSWESKIQGLLGDYDFKSASANEKLEDLNIKLQDAKRELSKSNDEWSLKLKSELESTNDSWRVKLKDNLEEASSNDKWNLKLKDEEIVELKSKLSSSQKDIKVAKNELLQIDRDLFEAVGNVEECYEVEEIEGIGPAYGKKFRSMGINTTCDFAQKFLTNKDAAKKASGETKIDLDAIQAWAVMADLMRLPGAGGQEAEIMQVVGVSSREELVGMNAKTLHAKMLDYNRRHTIVPDVPSLELLLRWIRKPKSTQNFKALDVQEHLNECYEVEEIEGIGPAYGKKFRKLGISTTCDFAKAYLGNNKAIKKAAKVTGIDFDAIRAWASMADLMRIAGVGGQEAEIMQTVGVDSKDEFAKISLNSLHSKMTEYNSKHQIVPTVPTLEMLKELVKKA